jgi:hypothetical protein
VCRAPRLKRTQAFSKATVRWALGTPVNESNLKRKKKIQVSMEQFEIRGTVTIRTKNRIKKKTKMEEARKIKISINSNKARETVDQVFFCCKRLCKYRSENKQQQQMQQVCYAPICFFLCFSLQIGHSPQTFFLFLMIESGTPPPPTTLRECHAIKRHVDYSKLHNNI